MHRYKKVLKYNEEKELVKVYESIQECTSDLKISYYVFKNIVNQNKNYNGYYYEIKPYETTYKMIPCEQCGKVVKVFKSRYQNRKHIFCDKKCEGEYVKNHTESNIICSYCGKQMHHKPSQIAKNKNQYCSTKCANAAKRTLYSGEGNHQFGLKGKENASWKSDERISYYGYRLIRKLDHPLRNYNDFVFEHRLVAEKYLLNSENCIEINGNKYLDPKLIVHHLDFNRLNNDKNNLIIMTAKEHVSLHKSLENDDNLIDYCNKYNIDFFKVKKNREYNIEHYKYKKIA